MQILYIGLIPFIENITEFLKEKGLPSKLAPVTTFVLAGAIIGGISLLPNEAEKWIQMFIGVSGGANVYYEITTRSKHKKRENESLKNIEIEQPEEKKYPNPKI